MKRFVICAAMITAAMFLSGCRRSEAPVMFHAQGQPRTLGEWHVLASDGEHLRLNPGVEPYALNTALFSDYAHKLRTIWMPPRGCWAGPSARTKHATAWTWRTCA